MEPQRWRGVDRAAHRGRLDRAWSACAGAGAAVVLWAAVGLTGGEMQPQAAARDGYASDESYFARQLDQHGCTAHNHDSATHDAGHRRHQHWHMPSSGSMSHVRPHARCSDPGWEAVVLAHGPQDGEGMIEISRWSTWACPRCWATDLIL